MKKVVQSLKQAYLGALRHLCSGTLNDVPNRKHFKQESLAAEFPHPLRQSSASRKTKAAFSLVEMLMALLVASLLMAALAPVMTKRVTDNVSIHNIGPKGTQYAKIFNEDAEFTIPAQVETINVTSIGGGGAGGGATFGSKEITSNLSNWTVPEGVTKIRVYMVGGGGGGASGGIITATHAQNVSLASTGETAIDFITAGKYKLSDKITGSAISSATAPALPTRCTLTGANRWTIKGTYNTALPGETISTASSNVTLTKVTACGGGGGGGGAGGYNNNAMQGGGSGGYLAGVALNKQANPNTTYILVGGGGGGGGMPSLGGEGAAGGTFAGGGGGGVQSGAESGASGGSGKGINVDIGTIGYITGGSGSDGISSTNGTNNAKGYNGSYIGTNFAKGGTGAGAYKSTTQYLAGNGGEGGSYTGGGGGGGRRYTKKVYAGGGGGGGGATSLFADGSLIFQVGGGGGSGGGGGHYESNTSNGGTASYGAGGGGGAGGGYGGGGGGAGGGAYRGFDFDKYSGQAGTGATGSSSALGGGTGNNGGKATSGNARVAYSSECSASHTCSVSGRGGYGGGGYGGVNGSKNNAGKLSSSIFDASTNCSGGLKGSSGLPGAMRLWYKRDGSSTTLTCNYRAKSNSGGGGGGGQIWIGEITVTPGEKLNFIVGTGGAGATTHNTNGGKGGDTIITKGNGAYIAFVAGANGGEYTSNTDNQSLLNTRGAGGGINQKDNGNLAVRKNWTGYTYTTDPRHGGAATLPTSGGGGKGGNSISMTGSTINGGTGGGVHARGSDACSTCYGAGGGGGGGVTTEGRTPGLGGNGANGYIYIEWGKTTGGGGAAGQLVTENTIFVMPRDKVKITVGKGGSAKPVSSGSGVQTGQKGDDGNDSYITLFDGTISARAKGGEGGYPGSSEHGKGGNYNGNLKNSMKGDDGTNNRGGSGGSTETLLPLLEELIGKGIGVGGCGGNMTGSSLTCANPGSSAIGKNGNMAGAGGGGGAISGSSAYSGGNGADGMVIIEFKTIPRG